MWPLAAGSDDVLVSFDFDLAECGALVGSKETQRERVGLGLKCGERAREREAVEELAVVF